MEEIKIPADLSSIKSLSESKDFRGSDVFSGSKTVTEEHSTSYYVRDNFRPLKSHQDNIERLLGQFKDE